MGATEFILRKSRHAVTVPSYANLNFRSSLQAENKCDVKAKITLLNTCKVVP